MPELRVNAMILHQHSFRLYSFVMNSRALRQISYVVPRSKDHPQEIQRALDPQRVRDIGEYIKLETSLLPNAIVVNLEEKVRIEEGASENQAILILPLDEQGCLVKSAYILDGQHRIMGFECADGVEFDLPVVAIHNASANIRGKIFTDINSKQKPPTKVHLLALLDQIGELEQEESMTMKIVNQLNEDVDSPVRDKIKMRDDDKGKWVTNEGMKTWILPHIGSGGILHNKTPAQQAQILKNYFAAYKQLWGDAWGSKKHVLTKAMGFDLTCSILREVYHRCALNEGKQTTVEAFKNQLGILKTSEIELLKGLKVPLDWSSSNFGKFTNKSGKVYIRKQLVNILQEADEPGSQQTGEHGDEEESG